MSWSHACKMRSACSWKYAYDLQRGTHPWRQEKDESFSGNPSISSMVSIYMKSLQRKKVSSIQTSSFNMTDIILL